MQDDTIILTLRFMAWQRAKGELLSILHTYWRDNEGFEEMNALIEGFIKQVGDNIS